jgi:single-strand DNA-binding protein
VFGKVAENVANSIAKGDTVLISGRLEQDEFTKKDGTKGKSMKLVADEVGVSCRWNAWVKDQTSQVMAQVGTIGKQMPTLSDEEPF